MPVLRWGGEGLVRALRFGVAAAVVAVVAPACSASGVEDPDAPVLRSADCPARISAEILTPVTCGWVRVPERHVDPDGPNIELFVARVQPNGPRSGEPALWLGYDVGGTVEYGSMASLADRVHREVVILDSRGTGFSVPHLGCPEVAAAAPDILAMTSVDPRAPEAYGDAVTACHARLTDGGVDVAAYGLDEVAADTAAVMAALELSTVSLYTAGSASLLQLIALRSLPAGSVRAAVLDNGPATATAADVLRAAALGEALLAADELCGAGCASGGRPSEWVPAMADRLDAAPVPTRTGDGVEVLVDGNRLRGVTAWYLEQHLGGEELVAAVEAAVTRPGSAPFATAEQALCLGQRAKCEAPTFAYGVWWTVQCRDAQPPPDASATDLCSAWPVGRSAGDVHAPVASTVPVPVPVLALYAALNPYVPAAERALSGLTRRTVVVDPTRGADVMVGCLRSWRDQWMDDPALLPDDLCPAVNPPVTGIRVWTEK